MLGLDGKPCIVHASSMRSRLPAGCDSSAEMALETYAKNMPKGFRALQRDTGKTISEAAENILQFLAEIEAGELAVELLTDFIHFRLMYEGVGKPRS